MTFAANRTQLRADATPEVAAEMAAKVAAKAPSDVTSDVTSEVTAGWDSDRLQGRLVELSGSASTASLTYSFHLIGQAQRHGEITAWVTSRSSSFFPPDAATHGLDLEALAVIRLPAIQKAPRVAELLVRSGGFGLVILDVRRHFSLRLAVQARLAGLAKKHQTALLFLTQKPSDQPSLGSLVSLRIEARRLEARRIQKAGNLFRYEVRPLKDKYSSRDWRYEEACHAPAGLY